MAKVELIMPKMGESIMEATILSWLKQPGDTVEMDEPILEIATDKVDSEVPSPVDGVIEEILFEADEVIEVGKVIAIISTEMNVESEVEDKSESSNVEILNAAKPIEAVEETFDNSNNSSSDYSESDRFYSPLVKNIAKEEGIELAELEQIAGSGKDGRLTKDDLLNYIESRNQKSEVRSQQAVQENKVEKRKSATGNQQPVSSNQYPATSNQNVEIIQMDRMRKLIAKHMVDSMQTSPHVTSFVEADVTNIVNWRNTHKKDFQNRYGEKLTFTPIFVEAVVKAIQDFPLINVSVDGDNIIKKNYINIGMAAATPSGNLIVPVIKNADNYNIAGLAKQVNDLANRARTNQLKPDEIKDGTFTLTNVGTFGNLSGTPIINQPQVAILSVGAIIKKPAVVETEFGDLIAVRHLMMMSLSYDHRVVDGFLGGSFLKRISDYLEGFDVEQSF